MWILPNHQWIFVSIIKNGKNLPLLGLLLSKCNVYILLSWQYSLFPSPVSLLPGGHAHYSSTDSCSAVASPCTEHLAKCMNLIKFKSKLVPYALLCCIFVCLFSVYDVFFFCCHCCLLLLAGFFWHTSDLTICSRWVDRRVCMYYVLVCIASYRPVLTLLPLLYVYRRVLLCSYDLKLYSMHSSIISY